jgi:serine/threonine protein kinase
MRTGSIRGARSLRSFGYEVGALLGFGGSAVVFDGRDRDGRPVAIKLPRHKVPGAKERLAREVALLGSLQRADGFVRILDRGVAREGPFCVLELARGGTLRGRLDAGPLAVREVLSLGREIAAALGQAHELGIVHRDIKPENVLLDAEGRPVVADLGSAKRFRTVFAPRRRRALSGAFFGTPGYMAPEMIEGAPSVGPTADVFALGCLLYECLGGRPAFEGESMYEVLAASVQAAPVPLRDLRPEVPRWLARAVHRALDRETEHRFADGTAFARALGRGRWTRAARVISPVAGAVAVIALALLSGVVLLGAAKALVPPIPPSSSP